jgi:hypothetical protein
MTWHPLLANLASVLADCDVGAVIAERNHAFRPIVSMISRIPNSLAIRLAPCRYSTATMTTGRRFSP